MSKGKRNLVSPPSVAIVAANRNPAMSEIREWRGGLSRRRMAPNVAAIGRLLSLRPWQKKKSPGAGIAEARTHYTERTTTQTRYYRARIECLGAMAVLRRFLVDLAFDNKGFGSFASPPMVDLPLPFPPLKGSPCACRQARAMQNGRVLPACPPTSVEVT